MEALPLSQMATTSVSAVALTKIVKIIREVAMTTILVTTTSTLELVVEIQKEEVARTMALLLQHPHHHLHQGR